MPRKKAAPEPPVKVNRGSANRTVNMTAGQLVQWREAYGVTQGQLAEWLGIAKNSLGRWEQGGAHIPPYLHLALDQLSLRVKDPVAAVDEVPTDETKITYWLKGDGHNHTNDLYQPAKCKGCLAMSRRLAKQPAP